MAQNERKILIVEIVEDETSLNNALREKFTLEGFQVLEAKDGEGGLDIALKEHPDLILLDILMPKMDGITMLKKLRTESGWGKTVPVIVLTNLPQMGKVAFDLKENKANDYMIKTDCKIEDVVARVHKLLEK